MSEDESPAAAAALSLDRLRAGLNGAIIGREMIVLRETGSTNDFVRQIATPEMGEGVVVFAEAQTAGRGQHGKHWASAPGKGLWLSIFLRPNLELSESAGLTTWLAEAIRTTIAEELNEECEVKPPNDVYIGDRKVAGILVEMRVFAGGEYYAIAGIGLNANQTRNDFPEELRATAGSLAMTTGATIDRTAFAIALLKKLDASYPELLRS